MTESQTPVSESENPVSEQENPVSEAENTATDDQAPELNPDRDLSGEVEALLLMAEEPMAASTLAQALQVPTDAVEQVLADLVQFYDETERGFELRHLGGGWRYYTRARHAEVITRYVLDGQQSKLSQAALETLAVVAYQQPISRSRVSAVRGVNVDGVIRTLLARGLIDEAGTDAETGAIVFVTTDHFLERIGVTSLDELPELAPHLPEVDELEAELGELARVSAEAPSDAPSDDPAEDESSSGSDDSGEDESSGSDDPGEDESPSSPGSPGTPENEEVDDA